MVLYRCSVDALLCYFNALLLHARMCLSGGTDRTEFEQAQGTIVRFKTWVRTRQVRLFESRDTMVSIDLSRLLGSLGCTHHDEVECSILTAGDRQTPLRAALGTLSTVASKVSTGGCFCFLGARTVIIKNMQHL
jgi:hypothetical protein